jgi:hypothetical protein
LIREKDGRKEAFHLLKELYGVFKELTYENYWRLGTKIPYAEQEWIENAFVSQLAYSDTIHVNEFKGWVEELEAWNKNLKASSIGQPVKVELNKFIAALNNLYRKACKELYDSNMRHDERCKDRDDYKKEKADALASGMTLYEFMIRV